MKPCQTLLNENMQQRGRKRNKRKGPKSWNINKTQKKGQTTKRKGEQIIFPILPHSQETSKGYA